MIRRIRKQTTCIGENKDADQLCSNCTVDQRLCFRYTDNTITFLLLKILNFKLLPCFRDCTGLFLSNLIGSPVCWRFLCDGSNQTDQNTVDHCEIEMSLCVRKPTMCICENKGADQLRGDREADQRLCFRHSDSTIPLLPTSKVSSF